MNPLRSLFLSISRMPPILMLFIILGIAVVVTMSVMQQINAVDADARKGGAQSIIAAHQQLRCLHCKGGVMEPGRVGSTQFWYPDGETSSEGKPVVTFCCERCGYMESYSK